MFGLSYFPLLGLAQADSVFTFLREVPKPAVYFSVGSLGELYVVNTANELKKYDENGDSVGVYNLSGKYGSLSKVEAQNPWSTILLYEKFSTLVLLDKYLNVSGTINLRSKNIFKVRAVTTSYDNNFWLFDELNARIKKIDISGNVLFESADFRQVFDVALKPEKILDKDGFLYLYDQEHGLYIFDYYGSFKNKFSYLNWNNFTVVGKTIYGFDADNMYEIRISFPDEKIYALPAPIRFSDWIQMSNAKLYGLKSGILWIYSLH